MVSTKYLTVGVSPLHSLAYIQGLSMDGSAKGITATPGRRISSPDSRRGEGGVGQPRVMRFFDSRYTASFSQHQIFQATPLQFFTAKSHQERNSYHGFDFPQYAERGCDASGKEAGRVRLG